MRCDFDVVGEPVEGRAIIFFERSSSNLVCETEKLLYS